MEHSHTADPGIESTWECDWIKVPDTDLNRETFELAPIFFFGHRFKVEGQTDAPIVPDNPKDTGQQQPGAPVRARVIALTSKKVFTALFLMQGGFESRGDDPSPWNLVEGSAIELATGRTLDEGETFPILSD